MIVSLMVAMDEQRGIGRDNRLPWRLRADLKRFKALTMGHHLIMGRKTYESITQQLHGRSLPGRTIIVVTRNPDYHPSDSLVAHSIEDALALAEESGETEVFIIGGGEIFAQTLELADRLYLTLIHAQVGCDIFFPIIELDDWFEQESVFHPADEHNQYPSTYTLYTREPY